MEEISTNLKIGGEEMVNGDVFLNRSEPGIVTIVRSVRKTWNIEHTTVVLPKESQLYATFLLPSQQNVVPVVSTQV